LRTLIWDFDGTLGYRKGGLFGASLLEVVQRVAPNAEVTHDQIRPYLQSGFPWHMPERPHLEIKSSEQWWEKLYPVFERALEGIGFDASQARSMAREARAVYTNPERWLLFDDVIPTLDLLASSGWRHVILSNHVPELRDIVQHLSLEAYIVRVFNSAETGYEKPHQRAFQIVLENSPDSEVFWMIGDSMSADIAGAESVGIPGILVRRHHRDAEHYCESLSQVPSIVCGWPSSASL
jgi:putative hydrolase of the HAD superfamily